MPPHKDHSAAGLNQFNPELPKLSDEDLETVKRGVAAFRHISRGMHRDHWLYIGRTLNIISASAMAAAHHPVGVVYNQYYTHFARKLHADGMAKLDKGLRSDARWMASEWEQVKKWLDELPEERRLKLNNPKAIKRNYDHDTKPQSERPAADSVHAKLVRARDEADYLRVELDEVREMTKHLIPPEMTMDEAAARICAERKPEEIRELVACIQARLGDEWWNEQPQPLSGDVTLGETS